MSLSAIGGVPASRNDNVHHNLFKTLLLRYKAKPLFAKQPCCIQTKMYRWHRKIENRQYMVIFLYNLFIFVWIQHFWGPPLNHINNHLIKAVPVYHNSKMWSSVGNIQFKKKRSLCMGNAVWSERSLSAHSHNHWTGYYKICWIEDPDQTAWKHRLIWA